MVRCFPPDGEGGNVVEKYPVLILLERPLMTVSGQASSRLCMRPVRKKASGCRHHNERYSTRTLVCVSRGIVHPAREGESLLLLYP